MKELLLECLDYCAVYLDDILDFSDTLEEHQRQVNKVLSILEAAGLQVDLKKSEFHVQETPLE